METRIYATRVQLCSAAGSEVRRIGGYAAKFRVTSNPIPSRNGSGKFIEMLEHGAFDDALASRDLDCVCTIQHDPNRILGRTTSRTLRLSTDDIGLSFECDLPNTSYADDLYESVKRGDMNECSFAFGNVVDEWDYDNGGTPFRTIHKVGTLRDVSVVSEPAYPRTEVGVRSEVDLVEVRSLIERRDSRLYRRIAECSGLNPNDPNDRETFLELVGAVKRGRAARNRYVVKQRRALINELLS